MKVIGLGAIAAGGFLLGVVGCGGDEPRVPPASVDDFVLDAVAQQELAQAQQAGAGADASYAFDEEANTLSISIGASDFQCDGPQAGEQVEAMVLELSPVRMVWAMNGDTIEWLRVDEGTTGIVGVWRTNGDPDLYLIISADGSATLVGEDRCDERPRNEFSCEELSLSGAEITIDSDLSDWDEVHQDATVEDDRDDYIGSDPGADIHSMKVEIFGESVFVLMRFHDAPSTQFQSRGQPNGGAYRLHLQGRSGDSFHSRVSYSPEAERWELIDVDPGVEVAVGADGIEWSVTLDRFGGSELTIIRVEANDCGTPGAPCETLDEIDNCGAFPGF